MFGHVYHRISDIFCRSHFGYELSRWHFGLNNVPIEFWCLLFDRIPVATSPLKHCNSWYVSPTSAPSPNFESKYSK